MAEINIQRKERTLWPWLLAGVLLLGLLWFLFARDAGDGTVARRVTDSTTFRDSASAAGTLSPVDSGMRRGAPPIPR